MTDAGEARLKRLKIRAWRRGIKEMDLILGRYVEARGPDLPEARLDELEALMEENDIDLYAWVTGREPAPPHFARMIAEIAAHARAR
jgi:antitoxin CptB